MPPRLCATFQTAVGSMLAAAVILSMVTSRAHAEAPQSSEKTPVTEQIACEHLFIRVADGPRSLNYAQRAAVLRDSGLDVNEVYLVIQTANTFFAAVSPIAKEAMSIHQSLKSGALSKSVGIPLLKGLDYKQEKLLSASIDQLKYDLGTAGAAKLEEFLDKVMKPTIVVNP